MTIDEFRHLDAWVRRITAAHAGLADPWRVVWPPHNAGADLTVQTDPVEAERRGHGPRAEEVCRIPVGTSFHVARQVVLGAIAAELERGRQEGRRS